MTIEAPTISSRTSAIITSTIEMPRSSAEQAQHNRRDAAQGPLSGWPGALPVSLSASGRRPVIPCWGVPRVRPAQRRAEHPEGSGVNTGAVALTVTARTPISVTFFER